MKKNKNKIRWSVFLLKFSLIITISAVLGFLGIGLPNTINTINNLGTNASYGIWASYFIISILSFYMLMGLRFDD